MVSFDEANRATIEFAEECHKLGVTGGDRLLRMRAGVSYRRALRYLGPDQHERRQIIVGLIGLEPRNLF